ncbi:hypothetical protein KJ652_04420 [Patescibacteria group bacterium]|nr:hypothetical protein [Patescibacteria group bacterium]MBU1123811.1 hypothetical protein [Patescibacteria group bacterium]MBU1911704.1 hypothetical protein [Patescibacteria group bacterium]
MKKYSSAIGIVAILLILGTADALLTDAVLPQAQVPEMPTQPLPPPPKPPNTTSTNGIQRTSGPNVLDTLINNRFTFDSSREDSLIGMIISDGTEVNSRVLIKDGDRAGFIAWTESPRVKVYYLALKEALHTSFTPNVHDLIDETKRQLGKPVTNLLTFMDPGISEDRLVFIRVRERLFEFHIPEGKDDLIFELVEKLTE